MGKFYIIATEHNDMINGPKKLLKLYEEIRPDMILDEMNQQDLGKFNNLCSKLEKDLEELSNDKNAAKIFMKTFRKFLGFETVANKEYAQKKNIPIYMIDLPNGQKKIYKHLESTMNKIIEESRKNGGVNIYNWLKKYIEAGNRSSEEIKEDWENFSAYEGKLRGELILLMGRTIGRIGKPDKYMESRIRELYDPDKVIAFPVGMLHALKSLSKNTVYSRIQDLNPERIVLI